MVPILLTRIKYRNTFLSFRVDCLTTITATFVTVSASKCKIVRRVTSTCRLWINVVNCEPDELPPLVGVAIFAKTSRALSDQMARYRRNGHASTSADSPSQPIKAAQQVVEVTDCVVVLSVLIGERPSFATIQKFLKTSLKLPAGAQNPVRSIRFNRHGTVWQSSHPLNSWNRKAEVILQWRDSRHVRIPPSVMAFELSEEIDVETRPVCDCAFSERLQELLRSRLPQRLRHHRSSPISSKRRDLSLQK